MYNIHYHIRLPGPLELERNALKAIYYLVRIVYVVILIGVALLALGGVVA